MKGTRQATVYRKLTRSASIPGGIVAGLVVGGIGFLAGCTSISAPTDAPEWYKNRVNERSAKRVPRFADLNAPVAPPRRTLEWQGFADDLARVRAVMEARAAEVSVPPAEMVAMFRARVEAIIAPGLVPLANDAPPVSPPRPVTGFAE